MRPNFRVKRNDRSVRASCPALQLPDCLNSMPRVFRALALIVSLGAATAQAHPEIEAAVERLNTRIAAAPRDPELYLERGELYAQHQDWISAEANFLRAAELAPSLPRLDAARGALALATGAALEARGHLDRALAVDSRDAEALILRSRA